MPLEKQRKFEDNPLWKLKLKLQFSGWLQYTIHAIIVLVLALITMLGYFIDYFPIVLFWLPLVITVLLTIALFGTIIMVKYDLHPTEQIPADKKHLDIFQLMQIRRSCRSFQSRNLTQEHLDELMEEVKCQTQPKNQLGTKSIRFEYVNKALTVWPVVGAHEFLVAIAPREYDRLSVIDIGRSLQKVVLHATRMGLATCWIGPGADQDSIIRNLGNKFDSNKDHVICVCAIGYSSMYKPLLIRLVNTLQHKRLALSELFFYSENLQNPIGAEIKPYNEYGRCYEVCQWSPSSYNGQTTRGVVATTTIAGEESLSRMDFYAATKSRYYAAVALGIWCANWELGCQELGKKGYFEILSAEDRGVDENMVLPNYDISWVAGVER